MWGADVRMVDVRMVTWVWVRGRVGCADVRMVATWMCDVARVCGRVDVGGGVDVRSCAGCADGDGMDVRSRAGDEEWNLSRPIPCCASKLCVVRALALLCEAYRR